MPHVKVKCKHVLYQLMYDIYNMYPSLSICIYIYYIHKQIYIYIYIILYQGSITRKGQVTHDMDVLPTKLLVNMKKQREQVPTKK